MSWITWSRVLVLVLAGVGWGNSDVGWAAPTSKVEEAEGLKRDYTHLYESGHYLDAISLAKRACSILEQELGTRSVRVASCLGDLAALYEIQGEYEQAERFYERAINIQKRLLGRAHPDLALSLNNLAVLYRAQGDYENAKTLHRRALRIFERALGSEHPHITMSLSNLAGVLCDQGAYEAAEPLYKRALAIQEKTLNPDHPDVAALLNNLAELHLSRGAPEKAEPLYHRALSIVEKTRGREHPDAAKARHNLGILYLKQGRHEEARLHLEQALAISEKALGSQHHEVATMLNALAHLHVAQGEHDRAELPLERALSIFEITYGLEHREVATGLNNLGVVLSAQGKYEQAKAQYKRALTIRENVLGPDHPDVGRSLANLAAAYRHQGKYEIAEPLFERALAIREVALGPEHPDVAQTLNALAFLYREQGEHRKAEPLFERALAIRELVLGPEHPDVAQSLNNLAVLRKDQGEHENARALHERALAIREKVLRTNHPDVAVSLNNLAVLYEEQGEYEKAEPLHKQALALRELELGPSHILVALSMNNLARLYWAQKAYKKAERLLEQALDILVGSLDSEHPILAEILGNVGLFRLEQGRVDSAMALLWKSLEIRHTRASNAFLLDEEPRRLAHATSMSDFLDEALSAHLQAAPEHHSPAELALTTLLRRKGLVLDVGSRVTATFRRSLAKKHLRLLEDLSMTRDRYAALSNRGPGPLMVARFVEQLVAIRQEQHQLWRELAKHSAAAEALSRPVSIADIRRLLSREGVLVEFVRYRPRFDDSRHLTSVAIPSRYAAYLVFPNRIDWVDLGPAEPIEQHVKAFRRALRLKEPIPTDLHDAVIQPVLERLGDARRLFIAPDAELNLVAFGALYDGEQYLVERYDLHYLTTGRDLLRPWDAHGSTIDNRITVVANPSGASLPGTEQESELLEGLFPHVETLRHDAATETNAQRRTQPWLLHLATHGFFEVPEPDPELERRMDEYTLSMSPSALPFAPGRLDNPMLHSGLLLAAVDATSDPDDKHLAPDGRLTAYEISGWDLRGTELVVLSACGTGLGEPRAGEGVLGLRRAFAMAGAQTQVMSLWDVSDATTAKLMEAYYRKLLNGKGRAEAMQEVQLEMLRSGEYHPGDWASFVVVGEWRPLSKDKLPEAEGPPPVEPRGCGCRRASVAGDAPSSPLVLALLGPLAIRRRRKRPHP